MPWRLWIRLRCPGDIYFVDFFNWLSRVEFIMINDGNDVKILKVF